MSITQKTARCFARLPCLNFLHFLHCLGMPQNWSGFMELERMGWMDPTPVTVTSTKAPKVLRILGLVQVSLGLIGLIRNWPNALGGGTIANTIVLSVYTYTDSWWCPSVTNQINQGPLKTENAHFHCKPLCFQRPLPQHSLDHPKHSCNVKDTYEGRKMKER